MTSSVTHSDQLAAETAPLTPTTEIPLARLIYGGTFGVAALILAEAGLFSFNGYISTVFLITCGLLVFLRIWLVGFALFFVFLDWDRTEVSSSQLIDSSSMWYAILMLILVISACRYLTLSAPLIAEQEGVFSSLRRFLRPPKPVHPVFAARAIGLVTFYEFVTAYARVAIACVAAAMLFSWNPIDPYSVAIAKSGLKPVPLRTVEFGITLFFAIVFANTVLSILSWRRISRLESRVYLNSVVSRWCFAEQRHIAKQTVKRRRKN